MILFKGESFSTVYAPLRDGTKLAVDVYLADDNRSLPVLLELTPYGRKSSGINFRSEASKWYENGYRFVVADARGTGDSEGEYEFFTIDGNDGYDLIEWISLQRWSNKRVGMRGSSYSGTNQWFIAIKNPPSLKCINPNEVLGSALEQPPYRNGAFSLEWALNWFSKYLNSKHQNLNWNSSDPKSWLNYRPLREIDVFATGKVIKYYRKFLDTNLTDNYWKLFELSHNDFSRLNIPSLAFTGWFDSTMYGTIKNFESARTLSKRKNDHYIIVGPYTHMTASGGGHDFITGEPSKNVGDLILEDNAILDAFNITRRFYDWCLKNFTRPKWQQSRVYITNSNYWISGDTFLPNNLKKTFLYLDRYGKLSWVEPKFQGSDSYVYNPNNPLRSDAVSGLDAPVDINYYLNRSDMLVYTSDRLRNSMTVFGDFQVELSVSSSARDTDFMIFLMDVDKENRSIRLGSMPVTLVRMRYRDGFDNEAIMQNGIKYNVRINLREIGYTFLCGHRIRLAITSSFYPFISANSNTGNPIATDTENPILAVQKIHYGSPFLDIFSRVYFNIIN